MAKYLSYVIAVGVIYIYNLIRRVTRDTVTSTLWIVDVESFIVISYKYVLSGNSPHTEVSDDQNATLFKNCVN